MAEQELTQSGTDEAQELSLEAFAEEHGVDEAELLALTADGTSLEHALGLIRAGYGRDYLATLEHREAPDRSFENYSASYLEAKSHVALELRTISEELTVSTVGTPETAAVIVEADGDSGLGRFVYAVFLDMGELVLREELTGFGKRNSEIADEVKGLLQDAVAGRGQADLRLDLERLIWSAQQLFAEEQSLQQ